ncbi:phosphoribosylglycinamide formyltransferase [Candidatus Woesearchaeota archaeon]|nr:phosphoribosylglycinamide formyltransferase [Candidatus Woesearchaeota archaeon]
MTIKLGVLASTNATDMQGIIEAINNKELDSKIVCLISNKEDCGAMQRAKDNNIEAIFIDGKGKEREEFDKEVYAELEKRNVDLILLIGYMRYLSPWFVQKTLNKVMNIHPSLLPAFAGGMDKGVHESILDWGCKVTGCTLHFIDEGADTGPIIIQKAIPIEEDETVDSLKTKIQKLEVEAFLEAIKLFAEGKIKVEGRIVRITR